LNHFQRDMRKDKETAKICMVFTDGDANDADEIPAALSAWTNAGVKVFAIGIGKLIDRKGLVEIAGSEDRVLQVDDFAAIGAHAKSLLKKICEEVKPPKPVGPCKWYCAVTQNRGVLLRTTDLQKAHQVLAHGNQNNRQAIIPMTDRKAGDPHTLVKSWATGSMWWWDWWDINQMRAKCENFRQQIPCLGARNPEPVGPKKWYCAVTQNRGVLLKTTDIQKAHQVLGQGNAQNRQAIIPMTDMKAGDPHTLAKGWATGSMWWWGWEDINQMRAKCEQSGVPNFSLG